MDRILAKITSRRLVTLALVIFAGGSVALCASFLIGVDSVHDYGTGRESGYAHATNWTLNFLLFMPIATIGIAWLVHVIPSLLAKLHARGMIRAGGDRADASWRELQRAKGEIGVHSLRMGQVPGEHSLFLASDSEII